MQYKWINRQNNDKLIVFFNGWGMDEKIVSNLPCNDFDVLVFFDYRNCDDFDFDFSAYKCKYLIAWSMGVYVCNYFYQKFNNFDKFIAINGTQKPVDDEYGIPEMIYNLTIENFNELSCSKFMKKISSNIDLREYCSRNLNELKDELIKIKELKVQKYLDFNKVIISTKDRIFPYKNQIKFWKEKNSEILEVPYSHYIFDMYKNWGDLL